MAVLERDTLPRGVGKLPTSVPANLRNDEVDSERFDPIEHARSYAGIDLGSALPTELERKLVATANERVQASLTARKPHEAAYMTALRMFNGDQWGMWSGGGWLDMRSATNPDRIYSTINMIRPAVRKHVARALSARTSISISPATGRNSDLLAARQARAIASHLEYILNDSVRMLHAILQVHAFGPIFEWTYADMDTIVAMPDYQDTGGEEFGVMDVKAGEVCSETRSWIDAYPDPKAVSDLDEDADWFAFATRRSLNYVRGRWKAGQWVQAGSGQEVESLHNRTDMLAGNNRLASESGKNSVICITMMEQPSGTHKAPGEPPDGLYPDGLYYTIAGDRVMECMAWPYKKLRHPTRSNRFLFPVTMLQFQRGIDTIWGDNAVTPVVDIQRTMNRLVSRFNERTKQGDGKILAARGSNIRADAFRSGAPMEIVDYTRDAETGGDKPEYLPTAPMDPTTPEFFNLLDRKFDQIMEVGDISRGQAPSRDSSGRAIEALQNADSSAAALFLEEYRHFVETYTKKRLMVASPIYNLDRLVFVQDTASTATEAPTIPPQQPPMGALPQAGPAPGMPPPAVPGQMATSPNFQQTADAIKAILFQQHQEPVPGQALAPNEDAPKMQAMSFKEFSEGRYIVTASITPVKSPQARQAMILDLYKAGAFLPEAIPTTIILLQLLEMEDADKLTTDLLVALKQIQKREDEINQQAQQANADAQNQKAQAQSELQQQKAQSDAALAQQKAQFDKEQEAASAESKIAVLGAQSDAKMKEIVTQHGVDLHHATHEHLLGQAAQESASEDALTAQAHQSALSRSEAEAQAKTEKSTKKT